MSQLAQVLAARGPELLRQWMESVFQHVAPGGESHAERAEPRAWFLQQLEAVLRARVSEDRIPPEQGLPQVEREQGARRFEWGLAPGKLVRAYGLLRGLLLDVIEQEGLQVSLAEVRWLNDFVDTALAKAVEEHACQDPPLRAQERRQQQAEHERLHQEVARQRAVAEAERARFDALIHQAPVCIGIVRGPQVVIEVANPLLCQIWGRTREQVVGKPLLEALPELKGHGFDDLLREVMATGKPFVAKEMAVQFARGVGGALETGYFTFTYDAIRDGRGAIGEVFIVATEVTDEVRSRQEVADLLARSQEAAQARAGVLDALANQTLVAVAYQRGPGLVFETANSAYCHMVGRDVVGMSQERALPELAGQWIPAMLERALETGEPYVVREALIQLARGRGEPLHDGLFDVTYQPVRTPDGRVDGVLTLMVEVTEQVLLRQGAQRLAEEERTRRDFEQHLIGIVSHDLRNPLGAILLGLQVLLRRPGQDTRTTQSLDRLRSSTERAVRLVRDLLDFTQARLGGGLKVDRVPMDLHAVARGVVEEFQVTHPGRELRLEQRGEGMGEWDGDRVAQLLSNLLGNALKYSPGDSPVVVRSMGGFEQMRLEVHNQGNPISPEAMERIFQPLQRDVEGPDVAGRSVGLGLYIVEQIVQAHAGDIQVNSTRTEGTTFSVVLPRST